MMQYYPAIKHLHIFAVLLSGGLFLLRGLMLSLGAKWPLSGPVRHLTMTVDTLLLLSAITLAVLLHQYPFVHGWLTAKVLLLVVYIVLGVQALKLTNSRAKRIGFWLAALIVYAFIISIARAHHWLGFFAR
jgi:uncharacterized membrane protein SirB2